jgi:hypothetical protein
VIHPNCSLTIGELTEEAKTTKTICHEILNENLGVHHIAAKFLTPLLSEEQKQNCVNVS